MQERQERISEPFDAKDGIGPAEGGKLRIVQELVPGRQITLAHLIANPDAVLFEKLGMEAMEGRGRPAIGVLTISPSETAVIFADIALKAAGVRLEFVDRLTGSLILSGTVSEVEASIRAIIGYAQEELEYSVCKVTKT